MEHAGHLSLGDNATCPATTVPEVYLKGFLDPAKVAVRQRILWVYEAGKKIRPRGVDAVAAVDDFNFAPELGDKAEEAYRRLEDAAAPILEKLRSGEPRLTDDEKGVFAYFAAFQKFRTTLYRDTLNAAAIDHFRHSCQRILDENRVGEYVHILRPNGSGSCDVPLEEAEAYFRDLAEGRVELEQAGTGWALVGALKASQELTPLLLRIHWTLLEAPVSEPWVTTDNPVALFEPFRVVQKREIYGPSLQFLFPISPRFLIFGEPMTKGPDDRGRVQASTVRTMTDDLLRIAHRQVYASFFSKELQDRVARVCSEREPLIAPLPANFRLGS